MRESLPKCIQRSQASIEALSYPLFLTVPGEVHLHRFLPPDEVSDAVLSTFGEDKRGPQKVRKIVLYPVADLE